MTGERRGPARGLIAGLGLLATLGTASGSRAEPAAPTADVVLGGARITQELGALAAAASLAPGEDVQVRELGRDGDTSHHLVTLRHRERLHRHDRHAITVLLLKGEGVMHIDGEERPVGEGSLMYVPRGAVHAFINRSGRPAVAYVLYSPPYDGTDRQPVNPAP